MKEQNESGKSHTSVRNKKLYMYIALGCAAVLLAAAIISSITAIRRKADRQMTIKMSSTHRRNSVCPWRW